VYIYNVQPGVEIDYATGESWESGTPVSEKNETDEIKQKFVLNTNSKKFHFSDCSGAVNMNRDNRKDYKGLRSELIKDGYEPCGQCKP